MIPFPLLLLEGSGHFFFFFSDIYREALMGLLEVNHTILCNAPYDWVLLEFLPLRIIHTEPPAILQLRFWLSCPSTDSCGGFHSRAPTSGAMTPCICLSVLSRGWQFALCPSLSYGTRRVVYFSVWIALYSSALQSEQETRSSSNY